MKLIYRELNNVDHGAEGQMPRPRSIIVGRCLKALTVVLGCALGISLQSCIFDDFEPTEAQQPTDSTLAYNNLPGVFMVNLKEIGSSSTRATWEPEFDDGIEDEYKFAPRSMNSNGDVEYHHYMLVYDNDDTTPTPPIPFPLELPNKGEDGWKLEDEDENITLVVSKVVNSSYKTADELIAALQGKKAYFLININESDFIDTKHPNGLTSYTVKDLKAKVLNKYSIVQNKVEYFTMTSSTYVKADGKITTASDIASDLGNYSSENNPYIFKTEAEAKAETAKSICTGYLERLASKITVKFPTSRSEDDVLKKVTGYSKVDLFGGVNPEDNYSYNRNPQDWTATILGYGINGLESEEYMLKNISAQDDYGSWSWNDDNKFRCYWSVDNHYSIAGNIEGYPHQYRRALEDNTIRGYHGGTYNEDGITLDGYSTKNNTYFLQYVSLKDIIDKKEIMYALENTYDDSDESNYLGDRGYFSAGTHLLLACRLKIDGVNAETDLYRDQNDIFYIDRDELLDTKLKIMQNKMLPGGNSGIRVYYADWFNHAPFNNAELITVSWEAGAKLKIRQKGVLRDLNVADLTFIPSEMTGGDGQLLIAPSDREAEYYIGETSLSLKNGDEIIPGSSYNRVISLFHKQLGPIDHFKDGYMYYAVPIIHAVKELKDASWNKVGDIGMVRNNWYEFTVNGVTSPGTPVDQIEQPIIPMMDIKRNYLNVSVAVLGWHYLPPQDVPLYPNLQ